MDVRELPTSVERYGDAMEDFWGALVTGTVIGAGVTGLFTLLKPLVDYGISVLTRRWTQKAERRAVVEGVVGRLRKLRLDHTQANREGRSISYELVLEAADTALLIHDRAFAKYLSLDIENTQGFSVLSSWYEQEGEGDPTVSASEAAHTARWDHLRQLVARASEFAVTGKWDKSWLSEAETLSKQMNEADERLHG